MNLKYIFRKNKPVTFIEKIRISDHLFQVLDPVKMSNIRKTKFMLDSYTRDWGMTKEDIFDFDSLILRESSFPTEANSISELNSQLSEKLKRIYTLVATRQAVIKEDYQYKPFIKAACTIILIDDEKENKIEKKYIDLKLQLCKENPEIEAFFLRAIMTFQLSIINSPDISKVSDWLPSAQLKVMESSLYKEINTTIYQIGAL